MPGTIQFSLLALISTAAAVPHYGHSRFHKSSAAEYPVGTGSAQPVYPTGGWYGGNSTAPGATGTGASGTGASAYPEESTTTIDETHTSTTTLVSTVYIKPTPASEVASEVPSSVGAVDLSSTDAAASCGPETIYVTATNQVTVTVTAGEVSPSSSYAASSSSASTESPAGYPAETPSEIVTPSKVASETPAETTSETPAETTSEAYVLPSSSAAEYKVSISIPQKEVETPTTTAEASSTEAAKTSSVVKENPVASSSPSYSGGKRGLAYNDISLCKSFAGKASWSYNWGSSPGGDLPEGVSFAPMPWIKNEDASAWLEKVDEAVASGSNVVMGFNEVDHPSQANLSPEVACGKWKEYMNPIASAHPDVTILGPSVTNNRVTANWGLDWYKNFDSVCPDAVYHAVNVHFYDVYQEGEGDSSTVYRFKDLVESANKQTGKKVWVTEFGLNPGSTAEQTHKFLTEVLEYLDNSDLVDGYSYFMVGTGENQLNAGTGLSSIGEIYASG